MKTKKLAMQAVFIALYIALSCLAPLNLQVIKISFAGLPVVIGALLFGPVAGLEIGLIGSFLYQILFSGYGITATTMLWVIPVGVRGLIVGWYAMKKNYHLTIKQIGFITILSALVLTFLNTIGIYIDSKIYGYYNFAYVFGATAIRIITGIATAVVFTAVTPIIMRALSRFVEPVSVQKQDNTSTQQKAI